MVEGAGLAPQASGETVVVFYSASGTDCYCSLSSYFGFLIFCCFLQMS